MVNETQTKYDFFDGRKETTNQFLKYGKNLILIVLYEFF